jgi:hypothetical protein
LNKIVVGGISVALGVSTVLASGAFAGGQGADRQNLYSAVHSNTGDDQCQVGTPSQPAGFTIFNAPGKPGATIKFNGEVSLKDGAPDTLYDVYLVPDGGSCDVIAAMLLTNGQGNGNAHLTDPTQSAGTYYVVLQVAGAEQFATPVSTVT